GGVTTFFGIPQNVNVLNLPALRVQNQGAVYFRIQMINNQAQTITVGVTGLSWYQSGGASRGPSNAAGTNIFNTDGGQNYQAP
ncbi:MAG: hypothetical protein K2X39_02730, partial [Silvanigrellaceae bacterium]|nr:hypothetical protein [Silvanigrellaceae bacterium]